MSLTLASAGSVNLRPAPSCRPVALPLGPVLGLVYGPVSMLTSSEGQVLETLSFKVGERFNSFEELEDKVDKYSTANYVKFYKRQTRTIEGALKLKRRHAVNITEALKYSEIKYACVLGGKKFISKSSGRRKKSTFQSGCEAHLSLKVTENGKQLVVSSFKNSHNHPITKTLYNHLPQSRKLPDTSKRLAIELMEMNVAKKKIQKKLQDDTGKVVLIKDLTNLECTMKKKLKDTQQSKEGEVSTFLESKYNASPSILHNSNNEISGIYFQTPSMEMNLKAFPEYVMIGSLNKSYKNDYMINLFLVQDSHGKSEIVGVCLLHEKDSMLSNKDSMRWMLNTFVTRNQAAVKIQCVVADRDCLLHRDIMKACLPWVKVLIYPFHSSTTFLDELRKEGLSLSVAAGCSRNLFLDYFQSMVNATSEEDYQHAYHTFKTMISHHVSEHFDRYWHPNRKNWVIGLNLRVSKFLTASNILFELIAGKIKVNLTKSMALEHFIEYFLDVVTATEQEIDHRAAISIFKSPKNATHYREDSPDYKYLKYLTDFSYSFVLTQLNLADTVTFPLQNLSNVSAVTCRCNFRSWMQLPCQHIFAVRKRDGLPLFSQGLCDRRWTTEYYLQSHNLFQNNPSSHSTTSSAQFNNDVESVFYDGLSHEMTRQEKYDKMMVVMVKIAELLSECTDEVFDFRMSQLQKIHDSWTNGLEVSIMENTSDQNTRDDDELVYMNDLVSQAAEDACNSIYDHIQVGPDTFNYETL